MPACDKEGSDERRHMVLTELERESEHWAWRARAAQWAVVAAFAWWGAAWVARWSGSWLWPFGREPGWVDLVMNLMVLASPFLGSLASRRHRRLLMTNEVISDVRSVGPLLEGLHMSSPRVHRACLAALTSLLPRVNEVGETPMTYAQRNTLANIATWDGYPEDLRVAALDAMRFVGDRKCLKAVENLTVGEAPTAADRRVRECAKRVLPEVRDTAQRLEAVERLLRPAEAPPESVLLRPVEAAPKGDLALLVRAADDAVMQERGEA
ncbi:MAG: hypothetical protein FJX72_01925 [Armatimonadetes bacterium]|nr:hypothetical protein [Armatimonadota bacterium]